MTTFAPLISAITSAVSTLDPAQKVQFKSGYLAHGLPPQSDKLNGYVVRLKITDQELSQASGYTLDINLWCRADPTNAAYPAFLEAAIGFHTALGNELSIDVGPIRFRNETGFYGVQIPTTFWAA